ncbi:MAG: hypothetical protein AB7S70_05745 [Hyphomicrobium sp.]|uniref:hypothetical protein n=1 Tax=Hyphomicrobium sp. TaxID=82 RepID=UPI003D0CD124
MALLAAALSIAGAATLGALVASAADAQWPTGEVLRSAMAAIRKATLDNHTLVTHRRMPPASAVKFAEEIAREVDRIRTGADVPPAAKPDLDALLADIASGAEAVAGRGGDVTPIDGILRVSEALARYPQRFDDPTWQPLR